MGIRFDWISMLSAGFFFSFFILLLTIFLRWKNEELNKNEIFVILFCLTLILIRGMFPFEIIGGKTFYIERFYYSEIYIKLIQGYIGNVRIGSIVFIIWIAGIVIVATKKMVRYYRFQDLTSKGKLIGTIKIKRKIAEIPIFMLEDVQECFITGLFKPKIILGYKEQQQCPLLLKHELEHYKKHDLWKKLLVEIVCTVYWWNPFNHYIRKCSNNLIELKTDYQVIQDVEFAKRLEYVEMISGLRKYNNMRKYGLGIAQDKEFIKVRVASLLNREKYGKVKKRFWILLFMIMFSFFIVIAPAREPNDGTFDIESPNFRVVDDNGKYIMYMKEECLGVLNELPKVLEDKVVEYEEGKE